MSSDLTGFREGDGLREAYERMRTMARGRLRATGPASIQATELAHEAWLRLREKDEVGPDRTRLVGLAAVVMRDILVERARSKATRKRGGDWSRVDWESAARIADDHPDHLLDLDDALRRLQEEDAQAAQVVLLKFYAGLTGDEVARALEVSPTTVDRRWAYARARLRHLLDVE